MNQCHKCKRTSDVVDMSTCPFCTPQEQLEEHKHVRGQICPKGSFYKKCDSYMTTPQEQLEEELQFRILFDYGAYEGMKFYDEKTFSTVDEAVKYAVSLSYATKFMIVEIHWKPL